MFTTLRRIFYRLGPRFPEDVQFARLILRQHIGLLTLGEDPEKVSTQVLEELQPLKDRGYSQLHINTICAEATANLIIEKALAEKKAKQLL